MAPPDLGLAEWWSKQAGAGGNAHKGASVVVKMENPNYSMLEIQNGEDDVDGDGIRIGEEGKARRGRNAKQLTWVLLLKAHKAAGCLAWLAQGLWILVAAIRKRLILKQGLAPSPEDKPHKGKLYKLIRVFLFSAIALLGIEILAHTRGWHFRPNHLPSTTSLHSLLHLTYLSWVNFRASYLAPPLQTLANACILLFLVQSADRLVQCLGCLWIKLRRIKPHPKVQSLDLGDHEQPDSGYPMVLVQIPMCNEREVYQNSISAVAQMEWPRDRMLIQVLDDSDDVEVQRLIKAEVDKWIQKGVKMVYRHRVVRTGYKAGNLKSAMGCDYIKDYEFVAIFDADFQPKPDFLKQTVIHFKDNEEIGLVQARWSFFNKDENLLTRLQYINLSYHFEVEQQVNGVFLNFFGFNGTAGVWRIKALEDSGGWLERTTVEDMDIAVRAHLCGWKFVFLPDVECLCELPEGFEAYRKQQHRWHSGPMQLFRLCLPDIISSKISVWKKINLVFFFFLLRKLILPFYSFTLFCIILPMTMFIPEAELPAWVVCYVPAIMSFLNILPAPKSFPFIVPYLLFENTMSVTKFNAMISGLFQLGSAYEWVVTKKTGRASETDLAALAWEEAKSEQQSLIHLNHRRASESSLETLSTLNPKLLQQQQPAPPAPLTRKKKVNRVYKKELALALLLLTAAVRSLLSVQGVHFYFLLFQGVTFLVVGLDLIGEQVS